MAERLNDLDAKEWVRFSKSWFVLNAPPKRDLSALHPATFPVEFAMQFIAFFTKKGEWVLDPFVGSGTTLVACARLERNGIGIDIAKHWVQITKERLGEERSKLFGAPTTQQIVMVGNAMDIDKIEMPPIKYVLTSPPYWSILKREGGELWQARQQRGLPTNYVDDNPHNLENYTSYDDYFAALVEIFRKVGTKLAHGAHLTIVVQNIKVGSKRYPLAWELALELRKYYELLDERIWCIDGGKLMLYGYPTSWVSNTYHRYCLVFRKP